VLLNKEVETNLSHPLLKLTKWQNSSRDKDPWYHLYTYKISMAWLQKL